MNGVSASKLDRALGCDASLVLPQVDGGSAAATRGTELHAFVAAVASGTPRAAALARVSDEHRYTAECLDVAAIVGGRLVLAVEPAFALDPETGAVRHLGNDIGRAYREHGLRDGEIPGSTDLIVHDGATDVVEVIDVKTGLHTTPAKRNAQLLFAAYCVARRLKRDTVRVALCYVDEDGGLAWDRATFDGLDLEAFASRLRDAWRRWRALDAAAEPTPGPWCRHCPSATHCPAKGAQVPALASLRAGWLPAIEAQLEDDATAAYWLARVKEGEELLAFIKTALDARAKRRPIPLGDGTALGPRRETRTRIDSPRAIAAIAETFGQEAANDVAEVKVTQAGIKRAFGGDAGVVLKHLQSVGATEQYTIEVLRTTKRAAT